METGIRWETPWFVPVCGSQVCASIWIASSKDYAVCGCGRKCAGTSFSFNAVQVIWTGRVVMPNIAHYKGDVDLVDGQVFGPDTCGAYYIAVGKSYDPERDCSTVQFKPYLGSVVQQ